MSLNRYDALSQLEKNLKAWTNPESKADWDFAMHTSFSPVFKFSWEAINAGLSYEEAIIFVMDKMEELKRKADLNERMALIREEIAASIRTNQAIQEAAQLASKATPAALAAARRDELTRFAEAITIQLNTLQANALVLGANIQNLNAQIGNVATNIANTRTTFTNALVNAITNPTNPLVVNMPIPGSATGQPMTPAQAQAWLQSPAKTPPLDQVVRNLFNFLPEAFNNPDGGKRIVSLGELNHQFSKYAELAMDKDGILDTKLMKNFILINKDLSTLWANLSSGQTQGLTEQVAKLREYIPELDREEKRLETTNAQIAQLTKVLERVENELMSRQDLGQRPLQQNAKQRPTPRPPLTKASEKLFQEREKEVLLAKDKKKKVRQEEEKVAVQVEAEKPRPRGMGGH